MTGFYLLDHPNPNGTRNADGRYWGRQHRRAAPTGAVVVHTAEVPPDYAGTDSGAENTARYFTGSTRPASYHTVVDSDSIVRCLPFDHEAYHDATGGNRWSVGVSMGTQAHTWGRNPGHDDRMLRHAATAVVEALRWWASLARGRDPQAAARWITPAQYRAGQAGLVEHGQLDPARRSDPWTTHTLRPELRAQLLTYILAELRGAPPEDGLSASEVADIKAHVTAETDRLAGELARGDGDARGRHEEMGRWLQDNRAWVPPRPVLIGSDPHQWLIVPTADGLRRIHLTKETKATLELLGVVSPLPPVRVDPSTAEGGAIADIPVV